MSLNQFFFQLFDNKRENAILINEIENNQHRLNFEKNSLHY